MEPDTSNEEWEQLCREVESLDSEVRATHPHLSLWEIAELAVTPVRRGQTQRCHDIHDKLRVHLEALRQISQETESELESLTQSLEDREATIIEDIKTHYPEEFDFQNNLVLVPPNQLLELWDERERSRGWFDALRQRSRILSETVKRVYSCFCMWLREWEGYDLKPEQHEPRPRYDPPESLCSDLAGLADDLLRPANPDASTGGGPPDPFASPAHGFDRLATLIDRISRAAKKAEGRAELARDLRKESTQTKNINEVLFKDKQLLQMSTPVFEQLSPIGQKALTLAAACSMNLLVGALSQAGDSVDPSSGPEALQAKLETAMKVLHKTNQTVKALLREHLLDSNAFHDPNVLEHFSHLEGGPAADLGLVSDAALRARNMKKRPDLFQPASDGSGGHRNGQKCSVCGGDDDVEVVSGKIQDSANDDFLTFPGRFNDIPIKPLIDTGGGCNLVKAEWIRSRGIKPDASRSKTLLMADGSESKSCPVVDVSWSFDGRNKKWVDVEFVVVEGYEYDALIGLPFLKHTETIHNSAGRLVFPEFKGVHTKKGAVPLYNFDKLKASSP